MSSDSPNNITPFPTNGTNAPAPANPMMEPQPDEVYCSSHKKLVVMLLGSPHDAASIARKDASAAKAVQGVEAVMFAEDLGRDNNTLGEQFKNEPLLAEDEVCYQGQPLAIIAGRTLEACLAGRDAIKIDYHVAPGILNLEHALTMKSYHGNPRSIKRGNATGAIDIAEKKLKGNLFIGSQRPSPESIPEVKVTWQNGGRSIIVNVPALMPTEVRRAVAKIAGISESAVELDTGALAGPANAMELEPVRLAALATHAARKTRSSIVVKLERDSPLFRGQRHPARATFEVGFDSEGNVAGVDIRLALDAGYYASDSEIVLDRAMLHSDGSYSVPNFRVRAVLCKTNNTYSSSMPAEGSAQGNWIMEEILQRVADDLVLPVHDVKHVNLYDDRFDIREAPYGQPVSGVAIRRVWGHVLKSSDYYQRFQEIQDWNDGHRNCKRGIAITPIRFGLGDPRQERNLATVLVQILPDGSVQVRPGVVDLQDGLSGQISEEVGRRLGVAEESIRVITGDFEVIGQATPVLGVDVAGLIIRALDDACQTLMSTLRTVAIQVFSARGDGNIDPATIFFDKGLVGSKAGSLEPITFATLIDAAWKKRENLMATGHHRSPDIWWDRTQGQGWPFSSFTYAAAVAEVQIDTFTGEIDILRVDIAHEGSPTINQGERDASQLARAFMIGAGWVLSEAVVDADAPEMEQFPVEQGISGFNGAPCLFHSDRLRPSAMDLNMAAGDPCSEAPVLMASAVRQAVWNALQEFAGKTNLEIDLPIPSTAPRVIKALKEVSLQMKTVSGEEQIFDSANWDAG